MKRAYIESVLRARPGHGIRFREKPSAKWTKAKKLAERASLARPRRRSEFARVDALIRRLSKRWGIAVRGAAS
jgi:hypothetical protein